MNNQQIMLIQQSFALLQGRTDEVAALFYQHLFELEPGLRPLFTHNIHQQGAKFIATLAFIIGSLKNPEAIIPAIKQLGQRHLIYGVRHEHYHLLQLALSATLQQALGAAFTPAVAEAWHNLYYLIAGLMKEAASQTTFQQAYEQSVLPESNSYDK
ncbi:MAG: hemin receptor [Ardenticatenaceae bacterium]|nr:hemin receptor [Ardenticatenaceae bacterium]